MNTYKFCRGSAAYVYGLISTSLHAYGHIINIHKACRPDQMYGRALKETANITSNF